MNFIDLNPYGGIGANAQFLEIGPFRILIDAGLSPERVGPDAMPQFNQIAQGQLDLIILTHCHLDHLGTLPVISRREPQAKILLSPPSAMLAPRMLANSYNVMLRQRQELEINAYPLFSQKDIKALKERFHVLNFKHSFTYQAKGEHLEITLFMAGHVSGAASVEIVYKHRRIFFTGDVLFTPQKILKGAQLPRHKVDTLVLETTRGEKARDPETTRAHEVDRLVSSIEKTLKRGGSVLIPSFALGRMQEILTLLHEARKARKIRDVPIFCTGLGLDLVNYLDTIGRKYEENLFRKKILHELGVKTLAGRQLKLSKAKPNQGIYVLSSGMLVENTPSYRMAARLLAYPKNGIFFVGYCAPDTPGGALLETQRGQAFNFDALDFGADLEAEILQFDLSGHADREELIAFAQDLDPRVIALSHGSPEARNWFTDALQECLPKTQCIDPEPLQRHTL